ncbi:hypothetical protein FACS1894176_10580 [Bacteroidia bacterium]|nr:hypothetical protein FACS1894176_10580 [Bacteroidia bacterium]
MKEEIAKSIEIEKNKILNMPNPVIFEGNICEVKYIGSNIQIKM